MKAGIATDSWKRTLDDYVTAAGQLFQSMRGNGFLPYHAIPVDPDMEILDGSHRVACALALGINMIDVQVHHRRVWAPPWDRVWFVAHGCEDLKRIDADWELMRQ